MPQIPREVVKARANRLRSAAAERRNRWLDALVGTTEQVLIENHGKGHTDSFAPVSVQGSTRGDRGNALVISREVDQLTAVWA
jgi:threonylcarbamoyladenosine tRNA methylthiotransferase MtaB